MYLVAVLRRDVASAELIGARERELVVELLLLVMCDVEHWKRQRETMLLVVRSRVHEVASAEQIVVVVEVPLAIGVEPLEPQQYTALVFVSLLLVPHDVESAEHVACGVSSWTLWAGHSSDPILLHFDSSPLDFPEWIRSMVTGRHYYLKQYSIDNTIQKHPVLIKLVESSDFSSILSMMKQRHLNIASVSDSKYLWILLCVVPSKFPTMVVRLDNVRRACIECRSIGGNLPSAIPCDATCKSKRPTY